MQEGVRLRLTAGEAAGVDGDGEGIFLLLLAVVTAGHFLDDLQGAGVIVGMVKMGGVFLGPDTRFLVRDFQKERRIIRIVYSTNVLFCEGGDRGGFFEKGYPP